MVRDFFTRDELEPCKRDIEVMVEALAQKLYKAGKVKSRSCCLSRSRSAVPTFLYVRIT